MIAWTTSQTRLLKYVAFGAMVLDHGHKAGLWDFPFWLAHVGKVAFPLFVITFAVSAAGAGRCRVGRLIMLGLLAQPAFMWSLGASWYDLNALFVFAAGWWLFQLGQGGRLRHWFLAAALLAVCHFVFKNQSGGLFWPLSVALALWAASSAGYVRWFAGACAICSWMLLRDLNQSLTAIIVILVIIIGVRLWPLAGKIPRLEFGFAYGAHLFAISCICIYRGC